MLGADEGEVTAGRESDGVAAGSEGAGPADSPQPASKPVASKPTTAVTSTVSDRLMVSGCAPSQPPTRYCGMPWPAITGMASRPIRTAVRQITFRMTS